MQALRVEQIVLCYINTFKVTRFNVWKYMQVIEATVLSFLAVKNRPYLVLEWTSQLPLNWLHIGSTF